MSNEEIIAQLRAENQQLREQLANMSDTASEIVFEKHAFRARVAACEAMLRERPLKVATMNITGTQPVASAAYMLWSQSVDALLAESGKGGGGNG